MKYAVRHVTSTHYAAPVRLARFNLRLAPAPWPGQTVTEHSISIDPNPAERIALSGPWIANSLQIALDQPTTSLTVDSRFMVEVEAPPPLLPIADLSIDAVRQAALASADPSALGPAAYLFESPRVPVEAAIADWAAPILTAQADTVRQAAFAVAQAINAQWIYDGNATESSTPPLDAFHLRRGVCQDFAQIMISALRGHGLPTAYVSGYLRTRPPPGKPRLVGADATHAWVAVWCGPQSGWVGIDPTNACFAGSDHIFTAMGRDYGDVAPVDGVFIGGAGQRQTVSVDVEPLG